MKAYTGKKIFSGDWAEKLNNDLNIFDTITGMCQLTQEEKIKGMPILLTGNDFGFYPEN